MFIVFEGLRGAGKSTQAHILTTRMLVARINACQTKEPWLESTKEEIAKTSNSLAHLLMYSADRCRHVEWMVEVLKDGWIVCDRYIHSTAAIQGTDPNLNQSFVAECIRQSITTPNGLLLPDLTIWLDLPVIEAVKRVEERDGVTVGEEERERMTRAYELYEIFHRFQQVSGIPLWGFTPRPIVRIDCDGKDQEAIADEVWGVVKSKLLMEDNNATTNQA